MRLQVGKRYLDEQNNEWTVVADSGGKMFRAQRGTAWSAPSGRFYTTGEAADHYFCKLLVREVENVAPTVSPKPLLDDTLRWRHMTNAEFMHRAETHLAGTEFGERLSRLFKLVDTQGALLMTMERQVDADAKRMRDLEAKLVKYDATYGVKA